jgi:hypothetical protein
MSREAHHSRLLLGGKNGPRGSARFWRRSQTLSRPGRPFHSPNLKPIDKSPQSKHLLRKALARSAETNCITIGKIFRAITPTECTNYFRNSAYAQS